MEPSTFDHCRLICRRELLEKYSQCRTSVEVIAAQDEWLEAERMAIRERTSIDYPPSASSSDGGESDEEGQREGEGDQYAEGARDGERDRDGGRVRERENDQSSSGSSV